MSVEMMNGGLRFDSSSFLQKNEIMVFCVSTNLVWRKVAITVFPHPAIEVNRALSESMWERDIPGMPYIQKGPDPCSSQSQNLAFLMTHSQVPSCQCFSRFR